MLKYILSFFLIFLSSTPYGYCSEDKIDKEISSNRHLKDLDNRLNEYYNILLKVLKPQDIANLKARQRSWLKERNKICSKEGCSTKLEEFYNMRVTYLKKSCEKVVWPIIDNLITDEENINEDNKEKKLQLIENCDLNICKAYKFYFHFNKNKFSNEKSSEFKESLSKFALELLEDYAPFSSYLEELNSNTTGKTTPMDLILSLISSNHLYEDINFLDQLNGEIIPLWLVKEHPDILEHLIGIGRFAPRIKAKTSLHNLHRFSKLINLIHEMEKGRWVTTSYMTHRGTLYRDIAAGRYNFINLMSFAPWLDVFKMSIKDKLEPLYAWSFEGIWNRRQFHEFKVAYEDAIEEIRDYYITNYNLKDYADKAEDLLASYIYYGLRSPSNYSKNIGYKLFSQPNIPLEELKIKSQDFKQEDLNISLPIAILNHYPKTVIEWIIKSGADINSFFMYETPLMKAVEQPEILNLLLENGANPNIATPYGKTALFYAVQYNNLESVKLLISSNVDINSRIKNKKELEELSNDYFLLEKIAGFTPLVYGFRYSSEKIIDYLIKNHADFGDLKVEDFEEWIAGNTKINKNKLNNILSHLERSKN